MSLLLLPHAWTAPCHYLFRSAFLVPLQFGYRIPTLSTADPAGLPKEPEDPNRLQDLEQENRKLRNANANLLAILAERERCINDLSGLRHHFGWGRLILEPAHIAMALSPEHLVLNRGKRDALQTGLYAIANNAIVGCLVKTNPFESELHLVTHRESSIPATIINDGAAQGPSQTVGKLDGLGDGSMRMRVNSREAIPVGSPVHARIQHLLDMPLLIGFVSDCYIPKEEPLLMEVRVEPATPLDELQEVCVLRRKE